MAQELILPPSVQVETFLNQNGRNEADEGHEGCETNEGSCSNEGDESNESEQNRERKVEQIIGLQGHQGKDGWWIEEIRPDQEQDWENCQQKKIGWRQKAIQRQCFGQMVPRGAGCPQGFGLEGFCGGEEGNASLQQGKIIDEMRRLV